MIEQEDFKEWLDDYLEKEPKQNWMSTLEYLLEKETDRRIKAEKDLHKTRAENNILKRKLTERISHDDTDYYRIRKTNKKLIDDNKRLKLLVAGLKEELEQIKSQQFYRRIK